MIRVFFLLYLILSSCSNHQAKPELEAASGDSVISKIMDSLAAPISGNGEFKGETGFLSQNFDDTVLINQIELSVKTIENYKFKDSIELENEEFLENMTDGGGSLTGYFKHGDLVKIKEWVGLSYGVVQHSFYFSEGQLSYVLETENDFYIDDSFQKDYTRFGQHFRGDYYFANNKLAGMVTLGHNRFEDDANDPEKEFLKTAAEYQKLILKRRKRK